MKLTSFAELVYTDLRIDKRQVVGERWRAKLTVALPGMIRALNVFFTAFTAQPLWLRLRTTLWKFVVLAGVRTCAGLSHPCPLALLNPAAPPPFLTSCPG